jgi:hypothetical protein
MQVLLGSLKLCYMNLLTIELLFPTGKAQLIQYSESTIIIGENPPSNLTFMAYLQVKVYPGAVMALRVL